MSAGSGLVVTRRCRMAERRRSARHRRIRDAGLQPAVRTGAQGRRPRQTYRALEAAARHVCREAAGQERVAGDRAITQQLRAATPDAVAPPPLVHVTSVGATRDIIRTGSSKPFKCTSFLSIRELAGHASAESSEDKRHQKCRPRFLSRCGGRGGSRLPQARTDRKLPA